LIRAAHQQITIGWWRNRRAAFTLYTSQLVLDEAGAGDPQAAAERLRALSGMPLLEYREPTLVLAIALERSLHLPADARGDALHLAVCAANGIEFLLTWNCRHLANAAMMATIEETCALHRVAAPRVVTPEQLLEVP
jgi:hypothetical protein